MGSERQVLGELPGFIGQDERESGVDKEAGRCLPGSAKGCYGYHSKSARKGVCAGELTDHQGAKGYRRRKNHYHRSGKPPGDLYSCVQSGCGVRDVVVACVSSLLLLSP